MWECLGEAALRTYGQTALFKLLQVVNAVQPLSLFFQRACNLFFQLVQLLSRVQRCQRYSICWQLVSNLFSTCSSVFKLSTFLSGFPQVVHRFSTFQPCSDGFKLSIFSEVIIIFNVVHSLFNLFQLFELSFSGVTASGRFAIDVVSTLLTKNCQKVADLVEHMADQIGINF